MTAHPRPTCDTCRYFDSDRGQCHYDTPEDNRRPVLLADVGCHAHTPWGQNGDIGFHTKAAK